MTNHTRVDPTKIEGYREKGYVKLEGIITGEPLDYYRELIGLAVGHRFKDDLRANMAEKRVYEQSFLASFQLVAALPGDRRVRAVPALRPCGAADDGGRGRQALVRSGAL